MYLRAQESRQAYRTYTKQALQARHRCTTDHHPSTQQRHTSSKPRHTLSSDAARKTEEDRNRRKTRRGISFLHSLRQKAVNRRHPVHDGRAAIRFQVSCRKLTVSGNEIAPSSPRSHLLQGNMAPRFVALVLVFQVFLVFQVVTAPPPNDPDDNTTEERWPSKRVSDRGERDWQQEDWNQQGGWYNWWDSHWQHQQQQPQWQHHQA